MPKKRRKIRWDKGIGKTSAFDLTRGTEKRIEIADKKRKKKRVLI